MTYCDECGNDIHRQNDHAVGCYFHPTTHMPYCDWCGIEPTVYWSVCTRLHIITVYDGDEIRETTLRDDTENFGHRRCNSCGDPRGKFIHLNGCSRLPYVVAELTIP